MAAAGHRRERRGRPAGGRRGVDARGPGTAPGPVGRAAVPLRSLPGRRGPLVLAAPLPPPARRRVHRGARRPARRRGLHRPAGRRDERQPLRRPGRPRRHGRRLPLLRRLRSRPRVVGGEAGRPARTREPLRQGAHGRPRPAAPHRVPERRGGRAAPRRGPRGGGAVALHDDRRCLGLPAPAHRRGGDRARPPRHHPAGQGRPRRARHGLQRAAAPGSGASGRLPPPAAGAGLPRDARRHAAPALPLRGPAPRPAAPRRRRAPDRASGQHHDVRLRPHLRRAPGDGPQPLHRPRRRPVGHRLRPHRRPGAADRLRREPGALLRARTRLPPAALRGVPGGTGRGPGRPGRRRPRRGHPRGARRRPRRCGCGGG